MIFHEITNGAQNDLYRDTDVDRSMVREYGMSERLGPRTLGRKEEMICLGREISESRN